MDDNIWEYPFGDIDDDDDIFFRKPDLRFIRVFKSGENISGEHCANFRNSLSINPG